MTKNELRKKALCKRKQLNSDYKNLCDKIIFQRLLIYLKNKQINNIFIYLNLVNEVDTKHIINYFLIQKINVYVPKIIDNKEMVAIKIDKDTEYKKNSLKINEPLEGIQISPEKLDLCIIPIVGFDENCNRLGFGRGYYDRFLKRTPMSCLRIGLAYEVQKCKAIPIEKHDITLDCIITEKRIYFPV
ncbi:5-formyltetrahydrofolate cyclo-ligase [Caldicellulosiruptoraceae bacterium PP1]